eukprot:1791208-Rhodomonas_salina.1
MITVTVSVKHTQHLRGFPERYLGYPGYRTRVHAPCDKFLRMSSVMFQTNRRHAVVFDNNTNKFDTVELASSQRRSKEFLNSREAAHLCTLYPGTALPDLSTQSVTANRNLNNARRCILIA